MKRNRSIECPHSLGFTLVEIMIVVAIIGVLAAIAIPSFMKARTTSQNTAFINDLRIIEGAINQYIIENKGYPADQDAGVMPPELAPYLPNMNWTNDTAIGGKWDYAYNVWGITCGIGVWRPSRTDTEMAQLGSFSHMGDEYVEIIVP